jgi:hypothetical protein
MSRSAVRWRAGVKTRAAVLSRRDRHGDRNDGRLRCAGYWQSRRDCGQGRGADGNAGQARMSNRRFVAVVIVVVSRCGRPSLLDRRMAVCDVCEVMMAERKGEVQGERRKRKPGPEPRPRPTPPHFAHTRPEAALSDP